MTIYNITINYSFFVKNKDNQKLLEVSEQFNDLEHLCHLLSTGIALGVTI